MGIKLRQIILGRFFDNCTNIVRTSEHELMHNPPDKVMENIRFTILVQIFKLFHRYNLQYFKNSNKEVLDFNGPLFVETWIKFIDYLIKKLKKSEHMFEDKQKIGEVLVYWQNNPMYEYKYWLRNICSAREQANLWPWI